MNLWRQTALFLLVSMVAALLVPVPTGHAEAFDLSQHSVPVEEILSGGPPKDGIPAILNPRFVPADHAMFLQDEDLVVGVVIGEDAKAYPIRILNWHEVVNDEVGNQPVAVTWCPLTQSAITFDRRVDGAVKTFGVSGRLYNSNVLMYDHQTESLWSQLAEAAVAGPTTDATLQPVPSQLLTWRRWKTRYPNTLVLSTATGHARDYGREPYARYLRDPDVMFPVTRQDHRLPAKAKVLGLVVDGVAKAYPLTQLAKRDAPVSDMLGGRSIRVHVSRDGATAYATDPDGRLLHATVLYWFAWAAFHPDTRLYSP